jgi:hypothetical protein
MQNQNDICGCLKQIETGIRNSQTFTKTIALVRIIKKPLVIWDVYQKAQEGKSHQEPMQVF